MPHPTICPGPRLIHRRQALRIGSLALGNLALPQLAALRAQAATKNASPETETAVILLFLHGGASQLETFDLKPNAPEGMRSMFRPIDTNVPGIAICEHLPRLASIADKFTLIRSLNHEMTAHNDGQITITTGKTPTRPDLTSKAIGEHPDFGHITSAHRGPHATGIPRYVALPAPLYATHPRYAGADHQPFVVSDPSAPGFRPVQIAVDGEAKILDNRKHLLAQFDNHQRRFDHSARWNTIDRFHQQAFNMLTSPQVARAFDLDREDPRLRDRYGRNRWGQSCLLARRLAEAGTAVVSVFIDTPKDDHHFTNWDDHADNAGRPGHFANFLKARLPYLDQALSTLIEDIHARSRDQQIMVVATGEFGRTPHIRKGIPGSWGRDHWPNAYSALIAGGATRSAQVIGATDAKAAYPTDRPLSPQDLLATVYKHLGVDTSRIYHDSLARPFTVLQHGTPILEL